MVNGQEMNRQGGRGEKIKRQDYSRFPSIF